MWETDTRGQHLLRVLRAKGMMSLGDKLENMLPCRSGITVPTEKKSSVNTVTCAIVSKLSWILLRVQHGSVQHVLLHFFRTSIWKGFEECWEGNGNVRGTGSLRCVFEWPLKPNPYDKRIAVFYSHRLCECWSLRNLVFVTCKVWLNFEMDISGLMHLKY